MEEKTDIDNETKGSKPTKKNKSSTDDISTKVEKTKKDASKDESTGKRGRPRKVNKDDDTKASKKESIIE